MHVTLCLEQEYAGYYVVKTALDGSCLRLTLGRLTSVVLGTVSRKNHLGKLFVIVLVLLVCNMMHTHTKRTIPVISPATMAS